ncbi:MAG: hypothetical protein EOO38_03685 [Cytophagaceae bacterium]|nr:MAG: hypothetical protein EOO38_03685 [Cytophagaceae bacterium]
MPTTIYALIKAMRREDAVRALVRYDQPLVVVQHALRAATWDWNAPPIATLRSSDVVHVLKLYLSGEIEAADVELWANMLEGREDVDFDPMALDAIFQLANPTLQGTIAEIAPAMLARLQQSA